MRGWVGPKAGRNALEKTDLLSLSGFEPLLGRPHLSFATLPTDLAGLLYDFLFDGERCSYRY